MFNLSKSCMDGKLTKLVCPFDSLLRPFSFSFNAFCIIFSCYLTKKSTQIRQELIVLYTPIKIITRNWTFPTLFLRSTLWRTLKTTLSPWAETAEKKVNPSMNSENSTAKKMTQISTSTLISRKQRQQEQKQKQTHILNFLQNRFLDGFYLDSKKMAKGGEESQLETNFAVSKLDLPSWFCLESNKSSYFEVGFE